MQTVTDSSLRQQHLILNSLEDQCLTTLHYVVPFCFILLCHLDEEIVLLRLNTLSENPIKYFGRFVFLILLEF